MGPEAAVEVGKALGDASLEDHVPIEEQALQGGPDVLDRHLRRFGLQLSPELVLGGLVHQPFQIGNADDVGPDLGVRQAARGCQVVVAGRQSDRGQEVAPSLL